MGSEDPICRQLFSSYFVIPLVERGRVLSEMREISKRSPFLILALLTPLLVGLGFFLPRASSSPDEPSPCPQELPGGLDRGRLLVLNFDTGGAINLEERVFLQDLEELLLANNYQLLSAGSELATSLPSRCVAWRLDIELHQDGDLELGKVELRVLGEVVETWQEQGSPDWVQLALRQRLAAQLVNDLEPAGNVSRSLHDPLSAGYRDRIEAMRLQAEGRLGEAAKVLRAAVARDGQDATLRFRLGQVLGSWAEVMHAAASRPGLDGEQVPSLELEKESVRLLLEAEDQLGRSVELDAGTALPHFARGQVRAVLGRRSLAEADFAAALAIWPAYGEAVRELTRLRLDRGEGATLVSSIEVALSLVDLKEAEMRADLLYSLGASKLSVGNSGGAVEVLQQALAVVPAECRFLRVEALSLLARAQAQLGDNASACATWQTLRALGLGDADSARRDLYFEAAAGCAGRP